LRVKTTSILPFQRERVNPDDNLEKNTAMKRILLVRHGQTDWNLEERWQGSTDVPLNAEGLHQARAVAARLRIEKVKAVYSSDLMRAKTTADTIATEHALTVQADPRWRELHLGVFQGLTWHEIKARYPNEVQEMHSEHNYMSFVMPQGESRQSMQDRTYESLMEIVAREPEDSSTVIVSHGGTIRVILLHLLHDSQTEKRSISNTSVTTLETDGQTWRLIKFADTSHLVAAKDHESL